jgi:predicted heme/steroid binding protein
MTDVKLKMYTMDEVKKHDTAEDLWMIIYNKVYDVTDFAKDHPGGVEVLYDCGGADATEAFDDVAHSDNAFNMLEPYLIGKIVNSQQVVRRNPRQNCQLIIKQKKSSNRNLSKSKHYLELLIYLILIVLAVFALGAYITIQKVKWTV